MQASDFNKIRNQSRYVGVLRACYLLNHILVFKDPGMDIPK